MESKDCSLPVQFDSGDELNDQIMREIEEEYARERLQREQEELEQERINSQKKKTKKGKKGKKSTSVKEDL